MVLLIFPLLPKISTQSLFSSPPIYQKRYSSPPNANHVKWILADEDFPLQLPKNFVSFCGVPSPLGRTITFLPLVVHKVTISPPSLLGGGQTFLFLSFFTHFSWRMSWRPFRFPPLRPSRPKVSESPSGVKPCPFPFLTGPTFSLVFSSLPARAIPLFTDVRM